MKAQLEMVTNFNPSSEIQKNYWNYVQLSSQNQPKFSGVFPRNNLPKIKDGEYVINFDEYKSIESHRHW